VLSAPSEFTNSQLLFETFVKFVGSLACVSNFQRPIIVYNQLAMKRWPLIPYSELIIFRKGYYSLYLLFLFIIHSDS
jgi:hypothetical protein